MYIMYLPAATMLHYCEHLIYLWLCMTILSECMTILSAWVL
jgi:hypothetical protein